MKKEYMKPLVEVVTLEIRSSVLAGSPPEWSGEGGSRGLDDMNDLDDLMELDDLMGLNGLG